MDAKETSPIGSWLKQPFSHWFPFPKKILKIPPKKETTIYISRQDFHFKSRDNTDRTRPQFAFSYHSLLQSILLLFQATLSTGLYSNCTILLPLSRDEMQGRVTQISYPPKNNSRTLQDEMKIKQNALSCHHFDQQEASKETWRTILSTNPRRLSGHHHLLQRKS